MIVAIYKEKTEYQTKVAEVHKYNSDNTYHINLISSGRCSELPDSYETFEEAEADINKMFSTMGATRLY